MKKLVLLLLFVPVFLRAQSDKILVTDLTKIQLVSSISTAKNKVIYTVNSIEKNEDKALEFEYTNRLYLLSDDKKSSIALTRGKEGVGQAELSPDGKMVAFVRRVKDKSQIFILPLSGGEPWQLTRSKYGASSPKFSPDGKRILYSAGIRLEELANDSLLNPTKSLPAFSLEKPGYANDAYLLKGKKAKANPDGSLEEIRAYLDKSNEDKKTRVFTRLNFQGEANLNGDISFSHLFEIEVREGAEARSLTNGFVSYSGANYTPDGKSIVVSTAKDPDEHPDRESENQILIISLSDLKQKVLLKTDKTSYRGFSLSPSGKKAATIVSGTEGLNYGRLALVNADGSGLKLIEFDRIPTNFNWTPDEKFLYFTAQSNGGSPVFRLEISSGKVSRLSDYDTGVANLNLLESGEFVYARTGADNPNELYLASADMSKKTRLTDLNEHWVKTKKLSIPEKHTYKNSIGQDVEFWVMKPANFTPGQKYPVVLQLHGGPTAMWGPGEGSMWHEFQYFAAQGYGVVFPNQRGSGGYGKDFQFSNYRDWGKGPQEDALGALDLASKESWVDKDRVVITGGSYAGYLTAWIIAHDHRFKAAFAQRGVYDLSTFMGEGNAWRLTPNYFGMPWEKEEETKIRENSPFTYVDQIRTPFLIKHGDNDLRTGVIQSEMMYKSLKYLNREVEYVRYQGATHELSRTGNVRQRIDRILRIHEFFQRYISK
jgi:dipeptidyl aminopeptidase/acylaminoacyl peptidase